MYNFNAAQQTENLIKWIKDWFDKNGKDCNAVLGISGGKDSTIAAALCVKALGSDRVIGVMLPDGEQSRTFAMWSTSSVLQRSPSAGLRRSAAGT